MDVAHRITQTCRAALGAPLEAGRLTFTGEGALPSGFAVTDFAAASIATAGLAVADLPRATGAPPPGVRVDRRLSAFWFASSLRPEGWEPPPPWDPIAGDYSAADGWIRLHTNAPHHRAAALRVLGVEGERGAVARAVALWPAAELEAQVIAAGGCAAQMRDLAAWAAHPQGRAVAAEPLIHFSPAGEGPRVEVSQVPGRPLAGWRVLDLTRILAGPVATRFLAAYGADVLRIDPPGWEEPSIAPEITPGKRCARLDLRAPGDRAVFERLLADAHILVHGYRPGALDGLGYPAEVRQALSPGLVDVSLDAYGWSGPWAGRRGFDSLVQMSAGIAAQGMRAAQASKPVPLPVQALDHATGYLAAAAAVTGMRARMQDGAGRMVRLSLARTAHLLAGFGAAPAPALEPETRQDLAPGREQTGFGPARWLRPPLQVEGAPWHWDRPAQPLGSDPPAWKK